MSNPGRILHVVEANGGGVRRLLEDLIPALVATGWQVTVAYSPLRGPESEEGSRRYAAAGARVIPIAMRRAPDPIGDAAATIALLRLMRQSDFDVVHCHSSKAGVIGRLAARFAGTKACAYSPHSFAFEGARWSLIGWLEREIERVLGAWTSTLIAVSAHEARQAYALGMPQSRVATIPNGIWMHPDTPSCEDAAPRELDEAVIGGAGRLVRQKGFDILIRAVAELRRRRTRAKLIIAGDGPERRHLMRLADRFQVPLALPGRIEPLSPWLRNLDVFVHAARWESLPMVVLEAIGVRVPIVATAVGGVPEIIEDGVGGLLAPSGDASAIAACIDRTLSEPGAASERTALAAAKVRERFSMPRVLEQYIALYQRMGSAALAKRMDQRMVIAPVLAMTSNHKVSSAGLAGQSAQDARPLVITDCYPVLSETFVYNEIASLRANGVDGAVFALRAPRPRDWDLLAVITERATVVSRGPIADWVALEGGCVRPSEIGRHLRILITIFGREPRWLLYGLIRTGTVVRIARSAERLGCTSVHAHFLGAPALIGAAAAAVADLPFSLSPHANLDVFSAATLSKLLGCAKFTVACWEGAAHRLRQVGGRVCLVRHAPVLAVPAVGNSGDRASACNRVAPSFRILTVSRLVPKKGIDVLLAALERLSDRDHWHLTVIGDGPERRRLATRSTKSPLAGRVTWQGAQPPEEVAKHLALADVLVVPSVPIKGDPDGIPNIILEAFAAGVPVVASATGGVPEVIVHGVTGFLVSPSDPVALADALLCLMLREIPVETMIQAAHQLLNDRHNLEQSIRTLAALHQEVVLPDAFSPV